MKKLKKLFVFFFCFCLVFTFVGCWDSVELNQIFIVVGMALDTAENPDEFTLSVEIAMPSQSSSSGQGGSGGGGGSEKSTIVLKNTTKNIISAINRLNFDSSRTLFTPHNHFLLISKELAEKGVEKFIDYYLRDNQARIETSILLVDGKAEDVLKAELAQEKTTARFLEGMLNDMEEISSRNRVRILEFASRLLEPTASPIVPIIKLEDLDDGKKDIRYAGFGFFLEDKLVGEISQDELLGYLLATDGAKDGIIEIVAEDVKSILYIDEAETKSSTMLKENNILENSIEVKAKLIIGEMNGIEEMPFMIAMERLSDLARMQIRDNIIKVYDKSREHGTDFLGFGIKLNKKNPKDYKKVKDNWQEVYSNSLLKLKVKVEIPAIGKIVNTIKMEKMKNENR